MQTRCPPTVPNSIGGGALFLMSSRVRPTRPWPPNKSFVGPGPSSRSLRAFSRVRPTKPSRPSRSLLGPGPSVTSFHAFLTNRTRCCYRQNTHFPRYLDRGISEAHSVLTAFLRSRRTRTAVHLSWRHTERKPAAPGLDFPQQHKPPSARSFPCSASRSLQFAADPGTTPSLLRKDPQPDSY